MSTQTPTPQLGWLNYPGLRLRPALPNAGRGRLQVQIRRAFVGRDVLSSSEVYDSSYARKRLLGERISQRHRHSVWRILRRVADQVGHSRGPGRPWLWRLKTPPE